MLCKPFLLLLKAFLERFPDSLVLWCPEALGKCKHSWIDANICTTVVTHALSPQTHLSATNEMLIFLWDIVETVIVVNLIHRALCMRNIHWCTRSEDYMMTFLHGFLRNACCPVAPIHHISLTVKSAFHCVIPTYHLASLSFEIFLNTMNEITLQCFVCLNTFFLHQSIAGFTLFPCILLHLICSNVDVM